MADASKKKNSAGSTAPSMTKRAGGANAAKNKTAPSPEEEQFIPMDLKKGFISKPEVATEPEEEEDTATTAEEDLSGMALEDDLDTESDADSRKSKITIKEKVNPALERRFAKPQTDAKELNRLWHQYKSQPNNRQFREKLILHYLHLVRYVVSRLPVTLPVTVSNEDLVSYGTMGLIEAVERFDPSRGLKFETYAVTRIRGAIIDQLRFQDWIPRGVRKRSKDLSEAMMRLEEKLGRSPTDEELATELGVTKQKLMNIMADTNNMVLSLDDSWGSDQSGNSVALMDMVEDKNSPDPQGEYEANELRNRLANAINALPEREKLLIALYYHENLTLKEIGEIISVSESRVCQLHAQAILRLRNKLAQS